MDDAEDALRKEAYKYEYDKTKTGIWQLQNSSNKSP
jgi:hypothetical protein